MEPLNGCPCQRNIRSLRRRGPTKEHSQVEGTQACWELRMWIKTRPRIKNAERLFLTFPDPLTMADRLAWVNCCLEKKKRKKEEVVASDLLVAILVVQRHNFAAFWCGKWWDLLLTHTHTHTLLMLMSLLTQLLAQSFIRRHYSLCIIHEIGISWACVACKLQKKKKKKKKRILYTHSQVMTLHILRWMAITVHQCSAEFIPKMIEATEDTDACCQMYKEILHWT